MLIVGAGPSGLMMAAQLLRYGIQPTIIDSKQGPDRKSKAIAMQARSLELFRQMGLADRILEQGFPCYGMQVQNASNVLGKVDFSQLENPNTPFPFVHIIGQDKTEKIVIDRLTQQACPVIWETRLMSLKQDDNAAVVQLDNHGELQEWKCGWVIGADGANSDVRKFLGIPFEGKRYEGRFFLADVHIQGTYNRSIHLFLPPKGFLGVFPLSARGHYRMMGLLAGEEQLQDDEQLDYGAVKGYIDDMLGFELPVVKCDWISQFRLHRRLAAQFGSQRCFLVGDAAHVHSPAGGQGMNTGLQDAANLAWKLAGVVSGRMGAQVLHTYQEERLPVVKGIINTTDWLFGVAMRSRPWLYRIRDLLLTKALKYINNKGHWLANTFTNIAQLNTHYRKSTLAVHHAFDRKIQAGDRVPFLSVYDEKAKIQTDLHRWCEKPGFVLLVLGTISHHHLNIIGQWVRQKYPREMHLYYLPYSHRNRQLFDVFAVKSEGTKIVLIRPDMHIGYVNDMLNVSLIDTYMEEVMRWKYFGRLQEKS